MITNPFMSLSSSGGFLYLSKGYYRETGWNNMLHIEIRLKLNSDKKEQLRQ